MKPTLESTICLATMYHKGQVDKAGKPYILHPLRVMMRCVGESLATVALLHDVLEDTDCTKKHLKEYGYSKDIINAVVAISRKKKEKYDDYISRLAKNATARLVKMMDLSDNLSRIHSLPSETANRLEAKYRRAYNFLESYGRGAVK